jgi:hypothetical protein
MKMLEGASMTAVPHALPGMDDFLVVSGGRSKNVAVYNVQKAAWSAAPSMTNSQDNSCSTSCLGYWFSMTGDLAKGCLEQAGSSLLEVGKPETRQVYRYNLTSGEHFVNNGEKQRGGAGCGCDDASGRVFWAGGYSNSGPTDAVEFWGVDPFHRRGEPDLKASEARRDVGAAACGGLAVAAGGSAGKKKSAVGNVDVFDANSTGTPTTGLTLNLAAAVSSPKVTCLSGRYAVIAGGQSGSSCSAAVSWLDTSALPTKDSKLPVLSTPLAGVTGDVAAASDAATGMVMFFDGQAGEVMSVRAGQ